MDSAVLVCTQKTSGRVYEKRGTAVAKAGGQEGTESCPALLSKYVLRGVGLSEAGTGMTAGKCVPLRLGRFGITRHSNLSSQTLLQSRPHRGSPSCTPPGPGTPVSPTVLSVKNTWSHERRAYSLPPEMTAPNV